MHGVVHHLTRVLAPVGKQHVALSVLPPIDVLALIPRPIQPRFLAATVLLVLQPLAPVEGPVVACVRPFSIGGAVQKLPLVDVPIQVQEPPVAVHQAIEPLAHVFAAIQVCVGVFFVADYHPTILLLGRSPGTEYAGVQRVGVKLANAAKLRSGGADANNFVVVRNSCAANALIRNAALPIAHRARHPKRAPAHVAWRAEPFRQQP
mmetsp:Transcript_51442/g.156343  ORF Transcript_51442/g.156343 Transcript_51442/m.156343 type:complete len:206 (-) Transcript_51442:10-627(-)